MLATDLDLVEVSMNFSHMDHEYEKICRRMNPPSVVDNEACKNAMVINKGSAPLTDVQLLWVNMIMDTLGALALAIGPPNNDLMKCLPVGERQNYISNAIWRNMLEQSFYQFTVIWLLKAIGQAIFHLD